MYEIVMVDGGVSEQDPPVDVLEILGSHHEGLGDWDLDRESAMGL